MVFLRRSGVPEQRIKGKMRRTRLALFRPFKGGKTGWGERDARFPRKAVYAVGNYTCIQRSHTDIIEQISENAKFFLGHFPIFLYNNAMAEQEEQFFKRRALTEAGAAYSVGAVLPVLASLLIGFIAALAAGEGYSSAAWYRFLAYLLPQICFAAAAIVFFRRSKVSVRGVYCGCRWYYFPVALLLQFGLMFSLSELNNLFVGFLESFGYTNQTTPLPPLDGWYLLPALLIIAVLPAIFEETLFRGILVGRMSASGWGTAATLLISGALFSLFHGNPAQTIYQFICGVCFALLVVRAGSILPSMAAHFANNALIVILTSTGYGTEGGWAMPQAWNIGLIVSSAVCLAASLVFLLFLDKSNARKGGVRDGKHFFFAAAVGIAVCAVQWIVVLITGFTA